MENKNLNISLGLLRLSLGWIFLWAFFDKLLGLGFSTCRDTQTGIVNYFCNQAWLYGGSPTFGFLKFATKGPFQAIFQGLAGNPIVDWLFMLGLLGIGLGLMLGIFMRLSTFFAGILLGLMYLAASILPEHNPFIDEHIIYIIVMAVLCLSNSGRYLGFGNFWEKTSFVQKYPILK
ncbi:MAG: hypothetical protein KatS3mg097_630 [Candidatus Parcubacteria bacterium]|nr:MAG: hypothetical protein KatS3mg097_630 [Candidatus Parcubacteria bacterium]